MSVLRKVNINKLRNSARVTAIYDGSDSANFNHDGWSYKPDEQTLWDPLGTFQLIGNLISTGKYDYMNEGGDDPRGKRSPRPPWAKLALIRPEARLQS